MRRNYAICNHVTGKSVAVGEFFLFTELFPTIFQMFISVIAREVTEQLKKYSLSVVLAAK